MLKSKNKLFIIGVLFVILCLGLSTKVQAAERINWNGRLKSGKDIYYWIDSSCQYTATIPQAVSKLRYPTGLWNPIVLNKTTTKSYSKMDFYQYYDSSSNLYAYTERYKAKTNGTENIAYLSELDSIEWIYGKIYLNDANLDPCDNDLRSTIILHEMCHVYGGKDVYDNANTIMYGRTPTVRGLTSDFNSVLVNKYNY